MFHKIRATSWPASQGPFSAKRVSQCDVTHFCLQVYETKKARGQYKREGFRGVRLTAAPSAALEQDQLSDYNEWERDVTMAYFKEFLRTEWNVYHRVPAEICKNAVQ